MCENIEVYEFDFDKQFDSDVERLVRKKRFHKLPKQIDTLVEDFEKGIFNGTLIMRLETPLNCEVYKLRLPNEDTKQGKSNGYRVIYAVITDHKLVVLLTIYYKKDTVSISEEEIKWLIKGYLMRDFPTEEEPE